MKIKNEKIVKKREDISEVWENPNYFKEVLNLMTITEEGGRAILYRKDSVSNPITGETTIYHSFINKGTDEYVEICEVGKEIIALLKLKGYIQNLI